MPSAIFRDHDSDHHDDHDLHRDKAHIEVILDTPFLTLKGTGPDVEPTRLSGNVVLYLSEATSIKEITLQFRGKARIPVPHSESLMNNNSALTYVICHHNWSFLEGSNKHARTLKAGRHFFPFHLEVGGSLPSSIATPVLGGASIAYKLRATAVRPLLAHNLHSVTTVPIVRSFSHEALEYLQTMEIENTWPNKIMYQVVLPHKAWATADTLGCLLKFTPLSKGVHVETILMNVLETTKIYARSGPQENTRVVASSRHDFIEGLPVLIEENKPCLVIGQTSPLISPRRTSPALSAPSTSTSSPQPPTTTPPPEPAPIPPTEGPSSNPIEDATLPENVPRLPTPDDIPTDIITALFMSLPNAHGIVPSHALDPILVSHRVRWSIFIRNPDSHISELRCSLPITVLDQRLLPEVRSITKGTRRAVLKPGLDCVAEDTVDPILLRSGGEERSTDEVDSLLEELDRELPTYHAHVRDRVANMYLPEAATMRITNPWVVQGTSPVSPNGLLEQQSMHPADDQHQSSISGGASDAASLAYSVSSSATPGTGSLTSFPSMASLPPMSRPPTAAVPHTPPPSTTHLPTSTPSPLSQSTASRARTQHRNGGTSSRPTSGYTSPLDAPHNPLTAHLPHAGPGSGGASSCTPLDWINCELMMSLSEDPRSRFGPTHWHGCPDGTRGGSRGPSRPGSPEGVRRGSGSGTSRSGSPEGRGESGSGSRDGEGHGHQHHHHHHHKGLGGFFKGAMKGLAFTKHHHHHGHGHDTRPHTNGHGPSASRDHHPSGSSGQPHLPWNSASYQNAPSSSGHTFTPAPQHAASVSSTQPSPQQGTRPASSSSSPLPGPRPSASTSALPHFTSLSLSRPASPAHHGPRPAFPPSSSSFSFSSSQHLSSLAGPSFASAASSSSYSSAPGGGAAAGASNDAMLHRAFTEVPDYSIAAKGFIGGVPPLSAMQGLPSYEESARERRRELERLRSARGTPVSAVGSGSGGSESGSGGPDAGGGEGEAARRVVSDGDLGRRFQGMVVSDSAGASGSGSGAVGPGESVRVRTESSGSGRSSDEGVIQMRSRRK